MAELGRSTVVADGRLSRFDRPVRRTIEHVEPGFTLHGLRIVYERKCDEQK